LLTLFLVALLLLAPFFPRVGIWGGTIILGVVFLFALPLLRNLLRPIFRVDSSHPVAGAFKMVSVALYGVLLLSAAYGGNNIREQMRAMEERQRIADAEKAKKIAAAHQQVEGLMTQAKAALHAKDVVQALKMLNDADRVADATNRQQPKTLLQAINSFTDPAHARGMLLELSDSDFKAFADGKTVPPSFKSDYQVLSDKSVSLARAQLPAMTAERQERSKQAAIEAERQKREAEVRAEADRRQREAEAAQRAAAERTAAEAKAREIADIVAKAFSPESLVWEYTDNEVAADQRLKGKRFAVTGIIDSVAKDILDTPYVSFRSSDKGTFRGVQCFFKESEVPQLARLRKGNTLTIEGTCNGLMMNVLMKDCRIVAVK
jgi:hypothetical protein